MGDLKRRDFLKLAGVGAASMSLLPGIARAFGQEAGKKAVAGPPTLVAIYCRGGMDILNVLVPFGEKKYAELRPTVGVGGKDDDAGDAVIPLDATFGLHPSLKALKPWWEAKKLAPVICVGSPHVTRSHFDAQDFMEYAAPGNRCVKAGWLNRYLAASRKKEDPERDFVLRAVAMQPLLPRALRGDLPVLAVPERNVLNNEKLLDTFEDVYTDRRPKESDMGRREEDPIVATGQDTLETLKKYKAAIKKQAGARKTTYPSGVLGQKLQDVASLIMADAGLETACIDIGGWDHHTNEGNATGTISTMLKNLGDGLGAFAEDLGPRLDTTLVIVMSEFGRTCRENGNNGTDHGHGGGMFLLGGAVKGGRVHGDWSGLEDRALYESRDLPVTTDFRDVFAEVLRNHLKMDPPKDFFPDYKPGNIKGLF